MPDVVTANLDHGTMIALLVVYVIIGLVCGVISGSIAKAKGHTINYFFAGFFLGALGILWVGFLPMWEDDYRNEEAFEDIEEEGEGNGGPES